MKQKVRLFPSKENDQAKAGAHREFKRLDSVRQVICLDIGFEIHNVKE